MSKSPPSRLTAAFPQLFGTERQRRVWGQRVATWDHALVPGLDKVVAVVLEIALAGGPGATCAVDLGCGQGQLALPLATHVPRVIAVDVSEGMVEEVRSASAAAGTTVEAMVCPIEQLELPAGSVDLVVSNYALHHLHDRDKVALVRRATTWLRPGGQLVIGDMMFGRGADARDRAVIASKIRVFAARGPAGWWRIAKNAARYLLRVQERPVSMSAWEQMLRDAGFQDVRGRSVVAEAGVVCGRWAG